MSKADIVVMVLSGVILYVVCDYVEKLVENFKVLFYRKRFPLDKPIKVKIDREKMNEKYYQLSEGEVQVLERTGKYKKVYITRKLKNDLVVTIEGEGEWTVFHSAPRISKFRSAPRISNDWVEYFRKGYFTKTFSFFEVIAFKKVMI